LAGEIFISYRRADRVWAENLHRQLGAEGIEAWYDAHVSAGEDWRMATAKALEQSQIFVLLFSKNAADSSDIAKELAAAVLKKKLIIPIRLEDIEPSGPFLYELASRNWINAYEDTDAKLAEVAKRLAQLVRSAVRDEGVLPFDHVESKKPSRKWRTIWLVPLFVGIALVAAGTWLLWPEARWQVETSRPFLSTLELEGDPAFSPDGSQLAYTSGMGTKRGIFVKSMAGGDRIKISADEVAAISPSWSPDGSHLVYLGVELGKPCRIMLATVPAGGVREVGRCRRAIGRSVTWQPGTRFIYFIDSQENGVDGIYRLNLDTGVRDAVVVPKLAGFFDLRCSPDGRWLLYGEATQPFGTNRIVVRDLASGKERIAARVLNTPTGVWQNSATWSEDSKTILVSAANGGGSDILAFPLDGQKPYKIYSSANPIAHMAMGHGGRLAAESNLSRKNLARASPTPAKQPDQLDMASGITFSPSFAQDGTMIFLSNRNGADALWIRRPGKDPVLLFDAGADAPFRAAIAPDGRHIAVVNFVLNHEVVIRILTADGASAGTFTVGVLPAGFPTWTPDSKALVIYDEKTDQAVRAEIDNPSRRTPVGPPAWLGVSVRDDGVYAIRLDKPGVWRIDGGPKLISSKYPLGFGPPLAFRGQDILIPEFGAEGGARILAQPLAGGPDRVIAYAPGAEDPRYQSKITVDPTNGEIIYVASVVNDTNIDILTLVRR